MLKLCAAKNHELDVFQNSVKKTEGITEKQSIDLITEFN
jgi:hypothetical protein